jgi:hypothetical protein
MAVMQVQARRAGVGPAFLLALSNSHSSNKSACVPVAHKDELVVSRLIDEEPIGCGRHAPHSRIG